MIRGAALALVCMLAACKSKQRPHDDALKEQILKGDHAPLRVPAPAIASKALATDLASRKLVFTAPITVTERRLEHFQIKNKITLDGPPAVGNKVYEHTLRLADRNSFTLKHNGGGAETVEWIAVENKAYLRHGKGPWRKKPYTLQQAEVLKNEMTFSLADMYTLFGEQMVMTLAGDANEGGRTGVKYTVELGEKAKTSQGAPSLLLKNDVEPVALTGECVVDRDTGTLLMADFKMTMALTPVTTPSPSSKPVEEAPTPQAKTNVKVRFQWNLDTAEDKSKLLPEAPADAVEDKGFDRPVADTLSFWQQAAPSKDDKDKEEDD